MVLLVTLAVLLAALVAVATAELGVAMVQRQKAQTAADAAALAGLDGGSSAAARLAALNGGQMVAFARRSSIVTVTVRVGGSVAMARASDGPTPP
jgi:Flp pilus assembly protein TadG